MCKPSTAWTVVILGAAGAWGRELVRRLKGAAAIVHGVDLVAQEPPFCDSFHVLDACVEGPERDRLLAGADLVVACLPKSAALRAVDGVVAAMPRGALWVDTLSIKTEIVAKLEALPPSIEALSINPLFAPSVDFASQCVLSVAVRSGEKARVLTKLVETWGARVIAVSAREHDGHAAVIQVATHAAVLAFGAALAPLRRDSADLPQWASTPVHRALLSVLARLVTSNPEVYWEIQKDNPFGARARAAVRAALDRIDETVSSQDEAGFRHIFATAREALGECAEAYSESFRRAFAWVEPGPREGDAMPVPLSSSTTIKQLRSQIDGLDRQLVSLVGERLELCRSIAELKRSGGIPMMQPGRVEEVKRRCGELGIKHGLGPAFVRRLYDAIIEEACEIEDKIIGAEGVS